ncbi:hypothetical protein IE53DRAFT_379423 [Violaceomyces palustris]|uniref:Uncharacterized protein n=1 Tax=Violaceomyces palustris TaxID=1673888 RepID=A0ACD0NYF9_9BASI|nr:hypothetical protein IE53DRAFT_379423 [Violaceomyces palustris]
MAANGVGGGGGSGSGDDGGGVASAYFKLLAALAVALASSDAVSAGGVNNGYGCAYKRDLEGRTTITCNNEGSIGGDGPSQVITIGKRGGVLYGSGCAWTKRDDQGNGDIECTNYSSIGGDGPTQDITLNARTMEEAKAEVAERDLFHDLISNSEHFSRRDGINTGYGCVFRRQQAAESTGSGNAINCQNNGYIGKRELVVEPEEVKRFFSEDGMHQERDEPCPGTPIGGDGPVVHVHENYRKRCNPMPVQGAAPIFTVDRRKRDLALAEQFLASSQQQLNQYAQMAGIDLSSITSASSGGSLPSKRGDLNFVQQELTKSNNALVEKLRAAGLDPTDLTKPATLPPV